MRGSGRARAEGPPGGEEPPAPFTLEEVVGGVDRRANLRRTPWLAAQSARMVWNASRRGMLAMLTLQLLAGGGVALQLLIARRLLNELIAVGDGAPTSDLYLPIAAVTAVSIGVAVVGATAAQRQRLLTEEVGRYAFDRIVAVASSVDYQRLEHPDFYDQLKRAETSGQIRLVAMVTAASQLVSALIATGAIAVVLAVLSPLLLGFVVLAAVPSLLAAVHNSRESHTFEYHMTAESRERAYLLELMTSRPAAKEVRLLGLGPHLRRRYRELTDERLRQLRRFLRARLRVSVIASAANAAGMAIALVALVWLLAHDHLGVASALTAGLAMQQLGGRLQAVTGSVSALIEAGLFLDDYQRFVDTAPAGGIAELEAEEDAAAAVPIHRDPRHLVLDGVSFTYPRADRPALEDVSLEVRPGEVVALVGANGSGKTTLVKLITSLYRPDRGRVLWDGVDAADLPPSAVGSQVSVVFQDYLQYHLSALDNIVFGDVDRCDERDAAQRAAARAGAHEFLAGLPRGYDTRMGLQFEGGHELSVGQWQRLALARAFFRDAGFLILDEPTAALDPRAERDLFARVRELSAGRSVIVISHRFSSVRAADRIFVLDGGRVIEEGSHDELMVAGGRYAELFEMQAAAYLADGRGR
ncbi:MAG TPA: ABC transporter ATP-binding protein [Baekduia sp.]|nr:ABC transporter ATP-binding protein [Baekduia sp.]